MPEYAFPDHCRREKKLNVLSIMIKKRLRKIASGKVSNILSFCSVSIYGLYALRTLRSQGKHGDPEVIRASALTRPVYASPAWL